MIDRHIMINEDIHNKILVLAKENKISYSEQVTLLVEEAIRNNLKKEKIDKIQNDVIYLTKKVNLLYALTKQIYSDFNISLNNITDPKKSIALNEFLRKVKISKLDE